ncbi:hypothetical protein BDZ94DRAFT_912136 [Collybia nuda]|uniref:Uncharacterized protein n=1 Tax=Collybia nuda TaxID=64659 RepID=A0A9P6CN20_9AGAR|nr:hypothetical protein BDZ94DRAFT_912136 [Collybia nuda]
MSSTFRNFSSEVLLYSSVPSTLWTSAVLLLHCVSAFLDVTSVIFRILALPLTQLSPQALYIPWSFAYTHAEVGPILLFLRIPQLIYAVHMLEPHSIASVLLQNQCRMGHCQ